jgi:hypothetical protein
VTTNAILIVALPLGLWTASLTPLVRGGGRSVRPALPPTCSRNLLLWPNIVLLGAILFTIGVFARQAIPVYLGAAGFFIGYIVASNYGAVINTTQRYRCSPIPSGSTPCSQ